MHRLSENPTSVKCFLTLSFTDKNLVYSYHPPCVLHVRQLILLLPGIYNPYEFEPPHSGGSEITHKNAPQSVGLLWTSDQPVAETST